MACRVHRAVIGQAFNVSDCAAPITTAMRGLAACRQRYEQRRTILSTSLRYPDSEGAGMSSTTHSAMAYLFSGIHVVLALSYLNPGALFRSSLV
jgi:hypothetical protein